MSTFGSPSSDLPKGKKFLKKLLYVQHVDKEKKMTSEIPERILQHLLADDRRAFHDSNSTENVGNPKSNLDILKSFLKDRIIVVRVFSNPLPFPLGSSSRVTFHAFVVFVTRNTSTNSKKIMWWTLEKNGKYIVLQQSSNKDDVLEKVYDAEKDQSVERYGRVKQKKFAMGNFTHLKYLLQVIWETNQIIDPYHLLYSNCQQFASFIFENLNGERKKWSTYLSATVNLIRGRKKKAAIEVNAVMHQSIFNDDKFDCYRAMMDGRREDFEELIKEMTIECLNSVDSQDYTLLEWATVFSSSDWLIDKFLKEKGAKVSSDEEGLFRRNVFFIALQYLPPKKKSKFLSFDGIDIHGVANKTGDTSLHLALYGEKWQIAEEILNRMKDDEVNLTNSLGDTPLHLAANLKCQIDLFTKILSRTHSANVNKTDGNGWTALHYAIDKKSRTKVEELLNHKEVNVNIQNNEDNSIALHLASNWPNIPVDLFNLILDKSTDINARDINGNTALHYAITTKSERAIKKLLKHEKVNVNVTNNRDALALHLACICENFPMDLFQIILEKTENINAQDEEEATALSYAIFFQSETNSKELLKHENVDVNITNNEDNRTSLQLASYWKEIPMDLFQIILEKTTDVNAQDKDGNTALHFAIDRESNTKVEVLLKHEKVDVNVKNNKNHTALHLASRWKEIPMDLFKIILERSDDINEQDKDGWTALHYAINKRSKSKVEKLLAHEAVDVNKKNNKNVTALHLASRCTDIPMDLFNLILKKSTDVNAQNEDGWTALHIAFLNDFQRAIKVLLEDERVDVNVKNNDNRTALYYCLEWKRPYKIPSDLAERIRIESPDNNAQDEEGKTVVHPTMFKRLKTAVKDLLNLKDTNVNAKNKKGRTALHLVCMSRDPEIPDNLIKIIVKQSSDVNAQDKKGDTALHIGIRNLNGVAVKELLKREELNVNIKNNKNETAFHHPNFILGFFFFASLFLPKTYYTRSWRNPSRI